MLTKEQYAKHFEGFGIIDVVVQNRHRFYFIMRALDEENTDVRLVRVAREEAGIDIVQVSLFGYDRDAIYGEISFPEEYFVVIDMDGVNFVGKKGTQPRIQSRYEGGVLGGSVTRIKPIGKSPVIICSTAGDLLMRQTNESWQRIGPEPDIERPSDQGFEDFDGFALDDIYAATPSGLLHFNGETWEKVLNKPVLSVGCMGDGDVYATSWMPGTLTVYRGRGKDWECIYKDKSEHTHANPIRDTVWHDGKVWLGNWSERYAFEKGKYVKAFPPGTPGGGYLSARDGVMVCASARSAYWHEEDGGWHTLFEGWTWD